MPKFNFEALSPPDFEELMRDLLQAEWGVTIESFRCGRDRGIDLRYSLGPDNTTIVQCKNFVLSGFSKLLTHLRNSELPKVKLLNSSRYVVATTVRLSPDNKAAIMNAMSPFILNEQDVIGGDDVEALLSRHPHVEKANFKLWLTSTTVLQNVLHNAEHCRTDFEVERVQRRLPLFVQSGSFELAKEILDANRILILSGPPGIGKTTLAEMLLYAHLDMGFEPVVIESDVKEGRALFNRNVKQIFYFDDFLGQTFLGDSRDYFAVNRDKAIVKFMEMICTSKESRFILTTREHILQSAVRLSEHLSHSQALHDRVILTMTEYSFSHRSRMLYNHVYFSHLPQSHKERIASDNFFLDVVKHKNISPRLIEWLTSFTRVRQVPVEGYREYILTLLDDPTLLWEHVFNNQISEAARSALLCLYIVGDYREGIDFEPEFQAIHSLRSKKYNFGTSSSDFINALRELDGTFFSHSRNHTSFLNPTVKEYVGKVIVASKQVVEDLVGGAIRFMQLINLWKLVGKNFNLPSHQFCQMTNAKFAARIQELLSNSIYHSYKNDEGKICCARIDATNEDRLLFLAQLAEGEKSLVTITVFQSMVENLFNRMDDSYYISIYFTCRLLEDVVECKWFLENIGIDIKDGIAQKLVLSAENADASNWSELLELVEKNECFDNGQKLKIKCHFEYYKNFGIRDDVGGAIELEDKESLLNDLEKLSEVSGHSFGEIIKLKEKIASMDKVNDELTDGGAHYRIKSEAVRPKDELTEDQVREMFRTITELA